MIIIEFNVKPDDLVQILYALFKWA